MFSKFGAIKIATAIAGFAVIGFSSEAQATTFNFTTTSSGYSLEKYFSADGIDLTVAARTVNDLGTIISPLASAPAGTVGVGQWSGLGLGLKNSPTDNSHTVDGYGLNDLLMLTFSSSVKFISATFKYAGVEEHSDDDFAFFANNDADTSIAGDMIFSSEEMTGSGNNTRSYNFTTGTTGTGLFAGEYISKMFGIGAIFDAAYQECVRYRRGNCKEWDSYTVYDSFKLASVTVEKILPPPPDTTPQVPLPAGLVLLLSGLTGMGFLGRFKNKLSRAVA